MSLLHLAVLLPFCFLSLESFEQFPHDDCQLIECFDFFLIQIFLQLFIIFFYKFEKILKIQKLTLKYLIELSRVKNNFSREQEVKIITKIINLKIF